MVEKVQLQTRRKGVRAMSGRPIRVQASTVRESRRHHRRIRQRHLLVASETKRDEEQAINDLQSCFLVKD